MIMYLVWKKSMGQYNIPECNMKKRCIHVAMAYWANRLVLGQVGGWPCLDG